MRFTVVSTYAIGKVTFHSDIITCTLTWQTLTVPARVDALIAMHVITSVTGPRMETDWIVTVPAVRTEPYAETTGDGIEDYPQGTA